MIKIKNSELAILGAKPSFDEIIPLGQLNIPQWGHFEERFRDIFAREYYTNQGPLAVELEDKLQDYFGAKHVICMANATIALMIAAKALELNGKVICPSFSFVATAQSILWAGLEPVFCDVDPKTHLMTVDNVEKFIDNDVCAILGVHLWGNPCNPEELQNLANRNNLQIYFDAAHAFGSSFADTPIANFGAMEIFSFHANNILNSAEGGCVCTNDDYLASKLRNIRSSYGAGSPVSIPLSGNGRMSEAQAAMALISFDNYSINRERNKINFECYKENLNEIPGIRLLHPSESDTSNYQNIVIDISESEYGLSRDLLQKILQAENVDCRNYISSGVHRTIPFCNDYPEYLNDLPNTDELCLRVMQLPSGQHVTTDIIYTIVQIIKFVHKNASTLYSLSD